MPRSASPAKAPAAPVLTRRALNRALLDRQMLLHRSNRTTEEAIEHLVGMQAQAPLAPYAARLENFRHEELSDLIRTRRVVRIALMRGTLHVVTADTCLKLRPLLQPILDRGTKTTFGRRLEGVDLKALGAAGRALVEATPRSFSELGPLIQQRWPAVDPEALANAIRALVPLVQVPPRGIWGESGQATHTSAETWLGRRLHPAPSIEEALLRYLGAFGPLRWRTCRRGPA